jgi:hypothetical protein
LHWATTWNSSGINLVSPATLKKRILRTVLQEVIADTTDDPPSVHLKLQLDWGFAHRTHGTQESDGLSQPHQLVTKGEDDESAIHCCLTRWLAERDTNETTTPAAKTIGNRNVLTSAPIPINARSHNGITAA